MTEWICTEELPTASHYYDFETDLTLAHGASVRIKMCADTRYRLYVNEHLALEGPCQSPFDLRYYESADLTQYLKEGRNVLRVRVLHAVGEMFISMFRRERPALWIEGEIREGDTVREFGTDTNWSCKRIDSIRLHVLGFKSLPPMEEHLADEAYTPMRLIPLYRQDSSSHGYNPYGLKDPYALQPSPLPQMKTHPAKPFGTVRRGEGFLELDAGIYTTAKLALRFRAKQGKTVRLVYAECYGTPSTRHPYYPDKGIRDDAHTEGHTLFGIFDLLHASGDAQTFSPFWYRTFRFLRFEFDADADFEILELSYAPYFYPLDEDGSFACSDARLNAMWSVSRNTVLCCMHESFVDCPYYEQQQYDMDSALEALFTYRMGSDTRLPRKSLIDLAHSQMPDGMLQANYPSTNVQIIPDFTLFGILMVKDYLRYTGDTDTVRQLLGTLDNALNAFEILRDARGLISPTRYWHFVDWVPTWERGVPTGGDEEPLTVTCLMYAAALRAAAEIFRAVGKEMRAAEYLVRAEGMITAVKAHCYDTETGLYRNVPSRREFSQHTTLWAILSEAVTGAEATALLDRTFRSTVRVEECTFSMNHYLFRALERAGRYREYAPRLFEGWQRMLDLHCTTWCENPDDPRSECHGWSSAPTYEFSERVLGVLPTADGYASVRVCPDTETLGLTWARGTVPTPRGVISVAWQKADGTFTLSVTLPTEQMHTEVCLPDGSTHVQKEKTATYTVLTEQ